MPDSSRTYGYTLIRSDVEEEREAVNAMPTMQSSLHGLKRSRYNTDDDPADVVVTGPMAWVESDWFQGFSGLVIFVNALIIGLETDMASPLWWYIEQLLLAFFVLELLARLVRNGFNFFQHEDEWVWNLFDFSIVMSGVSDTWLMPLINRLNAEWHKKGSHTSVVFMLMRMCRLLRIVRLFRLVRIVRPLFELAMGVMEALQGMFWVLVFMVMTLYATAILCTRLIGHGLLSNMVDDDEDLSGIQAMFSTVDESMFTLFGTVSSWSLLKFEPLFREMPFLRPFFVLFYVYSAWALLAVMTGVVSENMIAIREQMLQENRQKEDMQRTMITEHLNEIFKKADQDNSGEVTREEFEALLEKPDLIKKIQKNTHMRVSELRELFDWIDHSGSGSITIDEFMAGFKWVNEPLRAKSIVKLQERLSSDLRGLEKVVSREVSSKAEQVKQLVVQPLRKVYAITEQLQNLDVQLSDMRSLVQEQGTSLPTPEEIAGVEERLMAQLGAIAERMDEIETRAQIQRL